MNKAEMIAAVQQGSGLDLSSKATGDVVDAVFDVIAAAIKQDGRFSLAGFGTWTVRDRTARMGRNPQTGAAIEIKASKAVGFKAAPSLKEGL